MNLHDTLTTIATAWQLNAAELHAYATEDDLTGWDGGAGIYPVGSLWNVEGQILYALVRALKPKRAIEFGTHYGCSANHIALALLRNGIGQLDCVDVWGGAGKMIDDDLKPLITMHYSDLNAYLSKCRVTYDFVFEDALHTVEQVQTVWSKVKLSKGGVIVSHDALHATVGEVIQTGIRQAGFFPMYLLTEPSDCGMALWRGAS